MNGNREKKQKICIAIPIDVFIILITLIFLVVSRATFGIFGPENNGDLVQSLVQSFEDAGAFNKLSTFDLDGGGFRLSVVSRTNTKIKSKTQTFLQIESVIILVTSVRRREYSKKADNMA